MRKIYLLMTAMAIFTLASCVKEMPENGKEETQLDENALAFTTAGSVRTRSLDAPEEISHRTFSLGAPVDGEQIYLQETVTTLDGDYTDAPATRGTPAYTSNIASLYQAFNGIAYPLGEITSETKPAFDEGLVSYNGKYWVRGFTEDPIGSKQLYLFMRMPSEQPGVVAAEENGPKDTYYTYAYSGGKGSITFNYNSPATASAQKDILFAGRPIQKSDFAPAAPVLFYHALTGVKFSTANHQSAYARGTRTYIKEVKFVNLKGKGKCTVYPVAGKYTDDNEYDSAKESVVKWENREVVKGDDGKSIVYSQTFDPANHQSNPYKEHYDYETTGATNDGYFPGSFYADDKANEARLGTHRTTDWNINDKDASLTFWFIPQEITPDVKMIVTFNIEAGEKVGEDITREINFGELLQVNGKGVEWKAGELRTYVLKAEEVAVTVEDVMETETQKKMVQIRNTGNVPEFIRATVVANWCIYQQEVKETVDGVETIKHVYKTEYEAASIGAKNLESVAVYGYKDATKNPDGSYVNNDFVDPWDLAVEASGSPQYGTFQTATLTETKDADGKVTVTPSDVTTGFPGPGWVKGIDGYYYYTKYLGVDEAATQPLFYTYTVNTPLPDVYLLDKALQRYKVDVHLVMDVVVQAVLAPGVSNTSQSSTQEDIEACNAAWNDVLGYNPISQ